MRSKILMLAAMAAMALLAVSPVMAQSGSEPGSVSVNGTNEASIDDADQNVAVAGEGGDAAGGSGGDAGSAQYAAEGDVSADAQYAGDGGDAAGGTGGSASVSDDDTNVINQENNTAFNFSPESSSGDNFLINFFSL